MVRVPCRRLQHTSGSLNPGLQCLAPGEIIYFAVLLLLAFCIEGVLPAVILQALIS